MYPEQEYEGVLPLLTLELWAPCKARWMWAGAVIFASATCSLKFAKASAATLLQQEKNNSPDLQRERVNIYGFICTATWPPTSSSRYQQSWCPGRCPGRCLPRRDAAAAGEEHSADEYKKRVNITSFICKEARYPSRRCAFEELETWP
jgi:hypothetical protein